MHRGCRRIDAVRTMSSSQFPQILGISMRILHCRSGIFHSSCYSYCRKWLIARMRAIHHIHHWDHSIGISFTNREAHREARILFSTKLVKVPANCLKTTCSFNFPVFTWFITVKCACRTKSCRTSLSRGWKICQLCIAQFVTVSRPPWITSILKQEDNYQWIYFLWQANLWIYWNIKSTRCCPLWTSLLTESVRSSKGWSGRL